MGKSKQNTKSSLNVPGDSQPSDEDNNGQSIDTKQKSIPDYAPTYDPRTELLITKQTTSALLYLLFYSMLMFTLPFGAYFGTRHLLEQHCHECSDFMITALSVGASVVTVYIIIAAYALHAYNDKDDVDPVPAPSSGKPNAPKKILSKKNE